MTTKTFLSTGVPKVENISNFRMVGGVYPADCVVVMRPSPLGNPFKVGSYLTLSFLKSVLSNLCVYPEESESDEMWVKRCLPHTTSSMERLMALGAPLGRTEAISCYGEWLRLAVRKDASKRHLVMSLTGKKLLCCCKPKACHADEIVVVFKEIKRGLL